MSELMPTAYILKAEGTNCDMEMAHAFEVYGATAEIVHVNELRSGEKNLANCQILGMPGGFSYGDDISSGRVQAIELNTHLGEQVQTLIDTGKPVLAICNGFQVAVKSGMLPYGRLGEQTVTLDTVASGRFNNAWIDTVPELTVCKFAGPSEFEGLMPITMQEANGEGRFVASDEEVERLVESGQVVFRYLDNTNGSSEGIAAICDPNGVILGMMPHPERSIESMHADRPRTEAARAAAAVIFTKMVTYAKEM